MVGLTNSDINVTQAYIDHERDQLGHLGLRLVVSSNAVEWRDVLDEAPGVRSLASTFDPDLNDIRERDMFWISLRDKYDKVVSCVGYRFLETDDFIGEWVTTWRLFGDRVPHMDLHTLNYVDALPPFGRRVGYGGGLWVHPDWRGHDLSAITSRLGRVFALRHFCLDYAIVFVERVPTKTKHTRMTLGWPNDRELLDGRYPARETEVLANIFWENKEETVAMCRKRVMLTDQLGVYQSAG